MQKSINRSKTSDSKIIKISENESKNCSAVSASLQKSSQVGSVSQPTKAQLDECFRSTMKTLIASNEAYFQNKLQISQNGKKKDLRLKIPSKTGITIYRKDYDRKYRLRMGNGEQWIKNGTGQWIKIDGNASNVEINGKQNCDEFTGKKSGLTHQSDKKASCPNFAVGNAKVSKSPFQQQKLPLKFDAKTMYQNEYVAIPFQESQIHKKRNSNTIPTPDDAPRFFDTHNKTEYLNWAGRNYVPSTKPEPKPAITLAPFNASSVYKTDYSGKQTPNPPSIFVRESTFPKFSNMSMITQSNYASEFGKKLPASAQIDCKPKSSQCGFGGGFKGNTEYQSQYILGVVDKKQQGEKRSLEELQTLIIEQL